MHWPAVARRLHVWPMGPKESVRFAHITICFSQLLKEMRGAAVTWLALSWHTKASYTCRRKKSLCFYSRDWFSSFWIPHSEFKRLLLPVYQSMSRLERTEIERPSWNGPCNQQCVRSYLIQESIQQGQVTGWICGKNRSGGVLPTTNGSPCWQDAKKKHQLVYILIYSSAEAVRAFVHYKPPD